MHSHCKRASSGGMQGLDVFSYLQVESRHNHATKNNDIGSKTRPWHGSYWSMEQKKNANAMRDIPIIFPDNKRPYYSRSWRQHTWDTAASRCGEFDGVSVTDPFCLSLEHLSSSGSGMSKFSEEDDKCLGSGWWSPVLSIVWLLGPLTVLSVYRNKRLDDWTVHSTSLYWNN